MAGHELPPRTMTLLKASAAGAHTQHMHDAVTNITQANNVVRLSAARMFDEPTPQAARAIDKILRNPR